MPPQSRGGSPVAAKSQTPISPSLRPYLNTLPSRGAFDVTDQRTPTGRVPDRDVATPTASHRRSHTVTSFQLGDDDRSDTEEGDAYDGPPMSRQVTAESEANDNEVEGVTLDDEEFERHYSRGASSEDESEDDEDLDGEVGAISESPEQERPPNGQVRQNLHSESGYFPGASTRPGQLSRVHSLPARPPMMPGPSGTQHTDHQAGGGLHTSQSTTALPPFLPPHYNRPPTPLPPSPSLTSLLRPPSLLNRSTASTRPTTPDSSDVETPNDTEAAVAHSARRANPVPPTSPKVPTYEYYGFVLYLASTLAFIIYLLWSYLPSPFLHALGITYYPNRWWSLAIPAWIVMLLIFIYVALLSYNVEYLTLPLASLECMVDDAANVAILDEAGRLRKGGSKRLVRDLEERAKFEREREAKAMSAKGRKSSRNSGSSSMRAKDKGRRRASKNHPQDDFPPEIPPRDYQFSAMSPIGPSSPARGGGVSPGHAPLYPFITTHMHATQVQHDHHTLGMDTIYPNWQLVWNEGTDAVMDVPIGGVCEVLYG
jgi:hypothetical protein